MAAYTISKGHQLSMAGEPEQTVEEQGYPNRAALQPVEFPGVKPRLLVNEGDQVSTGTPLIEDKRNTKLKFLSPVTGRVEAVNRGARRCLEEIVIASEPDSFESFGGSMNAGAMSREEVVDMLMKGGCWPFLRRRPFKVIPDETEVPRDIFIAGMNTAPLGCKPCFAMEGKGERFQDGIEVLKTLTTGKVHLCLPEGCPQKALNGAKDVEIHYFKGPHPAGNIGVQIHNVSPIKNANDSVWTINAQDVATIGVLFQEGKYCPERVIAVTGTGAKNRQYVRTRVGAAIADLTKTQVASGELRYISGTVLNGRAKKDSGFVNFYDDSLTVLPEGRSRSFLGWMMPGFRKYSLSRAFFSALSRPKNHGFNCSHNGSHRAIVLGDVYDKVVPLDIPVQFLVKACLAGDLETMEKLGIFECDEEDFALATFMCPSKTDVSGIIRQGLDLIAKEG